MSEPPKEWTLEAVAELVADMKHLRTECDDCLHSVYCPMCPAIGWELHPFRNGWIRRCEKCQQTPLYPWAWRLDLERVRDWLNAQSKTRFALVLDELKVLVDD